MASPSGAPESGEAGADAVGSVVSAESVPCIELPEGVSWTTVVAAAGASAEPVPTSVGTAKTEAKSLSAAGNARPRSRQRSTVATDAETRATNLLEGIESSSILIRGPCVRKSQKSAEVNGSPPKTALSVRGTSPLKPTPGIGEGGVFSPQDRMRYIPPSSTGLRLVDPLQESPNDAAVSKSRGVQCISETSVAWLIYAMGFYGTGLLLFPRAAPNPLMQASQYTWNGRKPSATASQLGKTRIGGVASSARISRTNFSIAGVNKLNPLPEKRVHRTEPLGQVGQKRCGNSLYHPSVHEPASDRWASSY